MVKEGKGVGRIDGYTFNNTAQLDEALSLLRGINPSPSPALSPEEARELFNATESRLLAAIKFNDLGAVRALLAELLELATVIKGAVLPRPSPGVTLSELRAEHVKLVKQLLPSPSTATILDTMNGHAQRTGRRSAASRSSTRSRRRRRRRSRRTTRSSSRRSPRRSRRWSTRRRATRRAAVERRVDGDPRIHDLEESENATTTTSSR